MNTAIVLIPILFPMVIAIFIGFGRFRENIRNSIVAITVFLNLFFIIYIFKNKGTAFFTVVKINEFLDIYLKIDKLGVFFSLLVSILWIFTSFYSMEYMKHEGKENRFFAFFLVTLGVTLGISFSGNLVTLYLFYEVLTLATFPLVIHSGSKEALKSGRKYLIYSFVGATFVLLGMIFLFTVTKGLDFYPKGIIRDFKLNKTLISTSYIVMFLGFGVKAALVPFHSWLPKAMVAPTPVSSLLHAVAVVKSGVFALIRITYYVFGGEIVKLIYGRKYLLLFVTISILMGSFLALHQSNLKKRLAYSTISQLGYILLGILILNGNSLVGGLLHLINHAVIKITLFFCVGTIMYTRGKTDIDEIKGIGKEMPYTMWCFTISSISLIGIPPTNGFVSKWYLAQGGLLEGKVIFPAILLISALLTAMYLLPIITVAFFKKDEQHKNVEKIEIKEAPKNMLVPIILITCITIVLGLYPNPVLNFLFEISKEVI
ncbi:monovalent cation/H+ antiporter subunit D family protein [Clostridium tetani]|nr:monovalent cation/H+ antiporter subunit D family protein [Clostridium tetani]